MKIKDINESKFILKHNAIMMMFHLIVEITYKLIMVKIISSHSSCDFIRCDQFEIKALFTLREQIIEF